MTHDDTFTEQELLEETRARGAEAFTGREGVSRYGAAIALVPVVVALWFAAPPGRVDVTLLAVMIAGFAAVSRIEFELGTVYTTPLQLVFVPMLLLFPPAVALPAVALGLVLALLPDVVRGDAHPDRLVVAVGNAWFAVGPAVLLAVAGGEHPTLEQWPLYLAMLGAQLFSDGLSTAVIEWIGLGLRPAVTVGAIFGAWVLDALLSPVALAVAYAGAHAAWAALLGLPLAALLGVFARQRREGLDAALELSAAYRRTAVLLGDVLEADDEYTGSHSHHVVELAAAVADHLRLDRRRSHLVELGALLHDVGKIRIPKAILLKPGPLDDAEYAEMKRHTIYGQQLLDRVGGPLSQVGAVVRASHERFDGGGYPDGLVGHGIPLESRIVGCCDAFSAMTTDRPYCAAVPFADALAELRRCAGTQFDPAVVDALCAVVESAPASLPLAA
jgi:HD-GYP domain-containing protein (c-di-GMP phosphodiesterase class II)